MKRIYFLLFLVLTVASNIVAQEQLPIVHSNAKNIMVKHEQAVVNWHLEPDKKPDIYGIGNNLKARTISIITDIDSTKFTIAPGNKQDFIIVYKNTDSCFSQITVLANPLFFHQSTYIPAVIIVGVFLIGLGINRKKISVSYLLKFGVLTGVAFWLMLIVGGVLHKNYSHIQMGVSELGTIGTRSEVFMAITTMLLAICSLLFSIGFIKASKQLGISTIPAFMSIAMVISMAWGAIFPSGNEQHGLLGPLPLFILIGSLLAAILWNKHKNYLLIRKLSLLSFFIMLLFIVRFIPTLQQQYEGLIQRTLWLGWSIWYIALSFCLPKLLRLKNGNKKALQ
jgi:hypothetical membrane protein